MGFRRVGIGGIGMSAAYLSGGVFGVPWWLSGGISPANCIGAYQARGAASLAASYVNLANPGTYDLTAPVAAPTWNTATGWTFDGFSQYLATGITPVHRTWSAIVRFSGATVGNTDYLFGDAVGGSVLGIVPRRATNQVLYFSGSTLSLVGPELAAGSLGIAGLQGYRNGAPDGAPIGAGVAGASATMFIGALNNFGGAPLFADVTIAAIAFYDITLTAPQMAAIAAAMALL